jgi:hypothetical protein
VPGTGSIFWWRIGARNRLDTLEPRPWPTTLVNDFGWVWTVRNHFVLGAASAARAAAAAHEERDALTRLRTNASARVPSGVATDRVFRKQ